MLSVILSGASEASGVEGRDGTSSSVGPFDSGTHSVRASAQDDKITENLRA